MMCETKSCTSNAVLTCHWPGRSLDMCQPCALRAIRVAEHMGFSLNVGRIPPPSEHAGAWWWSQFTEAEREQLGGNLARWWLAVGMKRRQEIRDRFNLHRPRCKR